MKYEIVVEELDVYKDLLLLKRLINDMRKEKRYGSIEIIFNEGVKKSIKLNMTIKEE